MGPPLPQGATESPRTPPREQTHARVRGTLTRLRVRISRSEKGGKKKNWPPCVIQLPELAVLGWSARSRRPSARICPARSCHGLSLYRRWAETRAAPGRVRGRDPKACSLADIRRTITFRGRHSRRAISGSFFLLPRRRHSFNSRVPVAVVVVVGDRIANGNDAARWLPGSQTRIALVSRWTPEASENPCDDGLSVAAPLSLAFVRRSISG
ncbi:hypothetical protein HPB50_018474 [Hyalomma asiaticum]|uniref:Uncharacterized protein n=1 Tax=Hyalomma asiaticum TaxID=266040 RepID=A0ACB7TK63_HYAAI|nr:hypothetical protein HPB50_018474 [Hyalomma asiaticum]